MRLCRFNDNRIGLVRGANVHDVTAILDELPAVHYPPPPGDPLIASLEMLRPKMEKLADQAKPAPSSAVNFLSPVANPSKIIGTPVNYQKHREEADKDAQIAVYSSATRARTIEEQGLFIKASSCLVGPSQGVAVRFPDRRTDHEAELGLIIGKRARNVSEDQALRYVAGYAIALDMVVRGTEDRSFRKSIDSYGVLGPWLVTADELGDPSNLDFSLTVNGEPRQASNTRLMVMSIPKQISWASRWYDLLPGDIIMTGTCEGVARVVPGDIMAIEFERIGRMDVPVRAAD
ncbi:MAG TPA: fumarylacetoacetate hydrolase family protein [Stellaceae bacterium]|nr:fumarylacetoacetate hydrolase family protein [Stellaceae bacterium]